MESGQLMQIVLTQRREVETFRDIIMEIDIEFPTAVQSTNRLAKVILSYLIPETP